MAYDANLVLQALTTQTASFTSTPINLPSGVPRRGLKAVVNLTAITQTAGTATLAFKIQESQDNTTFYDLALPSNGTKSTVSATGEIYIPFSSLEAKYYQVVATLGGGATSPSYSFEAKVGTSHP